MRQPYALGIDPKQTPSLQNISPRPIPTGRAKRYPSCMETLTQSTSPALLDQRHLTALVNIERDTVHRLIAWAAVRGPITLLDCACRFDATRTLELIHLEHVHFQRQMNNIHVSRPFTAYQLVASSHSLRTQPPPAGTPIILLSPLHLLYDDNVQPGEAMRLLNCLLSDWASLKHRSPVILTAAPPPADQQPRHILLQKLLQAADRTFAPQPPTSSPPQQLALDLTG